LREIFGDYRRLLLHRQLNGSLAGGHAFRGKALTAAAPGQPHPHVFHFSVHCLLQQSAVGIRHGNRMINHLRQHGIERQLRMQQRCRFQQHIQLSQAAAGGL